MAQRPPSSTTASFVTSGSSSRRPVGMVASSVEVDNRSPETMTAEERAAVQRGLDDVQAGRFATEAEVQAAFRRFRP